VASPRDMSKPEEGLPRVREGVGVKSRRSSTSWFGGGEESEIGGIEVSDEGVKKGLMGRTDACEKEKEKTHLERDTEISTVRVRDVLDPFILAPTQDHSTPRTLGHQTSRLEVGLLHVPIESILVGFSFRVGRGLQLSDLSLDEVGDSRCHQFDDFVGSQTSESSATSSEEEVTGEDGEFVSEEGRGGRDPSSERGGVDYVVVKEGSDVNHFADFGQTTLGWEEGWGGSESGG